MGNTQDLNGHKTVAGDPGESKNQLLGNSGSEESVSNSAQATNIGKHSGDNLVSFTVRIPSHIKSGLERLASTIPGMSNVSEAARQVIELALGDVQGIRDTQERNFLHQEPMLALQNLVAKAQNGSQFSRAELAFLANLAQRAYRLMPASHVQLAPMVANLQAFAAVRAMRAELHADNDIHSRRDRYYQSILSGEFNEPISEMVGRVLATLPTYPLRSDAAILSACLEEALRAEPTMPVVRLNEVLNPYLADLVKVAVRGHYLETDQPMSCNSKHRAFQMQAPVSITHGTITLIPIMTEVDIGVNIIRGCANVSIAAQSFPDLCDLLLLVRAVGQGHTVTGRRFQLAPPSPDSSRYTIRADGVWITLAINEFEDLRTAMTLLMEQPAMKRESDLMAWVYGES